jgi:uncharacterized protein YjiS (DUF1127 family)
MLRFLVEFYEIRRQIVSSRRCLLQFSERELDDVGLMAGDVPGRRR